MKKLHKIIFLILGIITLLLIEMDSDNIYGLSRASVKQAKGTMVSTLKEFHLTVDQQLTIQPM